DSHSCERGILQPGSYFGLGSIGTEGAQNSQTLWKSRHVHPRACKGYGSRVEALFGHRRLRALKRNAGTAHSVITSLLKATTSQLIRRQCAHAVWLACPRTPSFRVASYSEVYNEGYFLY